jgi:hypothetical protein
MRTLNELFRLVILANELGNNEKEALRFSDPDGVRSGKSGWSFGVCQFDTRNNSEALKCLADCGLTQDEIHGIVDQTIDVKPLALNLISHKDIVSRYDEAQLSHCINSAVNFCESYKLPVTDTAALLMLADTINQYGSIGSGTAKYLSGLKRPVEAHDILTYKLTWKYATDSIRGYQDTERRYKNLIKVVQTNSKGE